MWGGGGVGGGARVSEFLLLRIQIYFFFCVGSEKEVGGVVRGGSGVSEFIFSTTCMNPNLK